MSLFLQLVRFQRLCRQFLESARERFEKKLLLGGQHQISQKSGIRIQESGVAEVAEYFYSFFASQIPDQQTDPKHPGYHRNADADRKSRGCVNNLQMVMARRQRHRAEDVIGWYQVIGLLGAVGQCFDVPVVIVQIGNEKESWFVGIGFDHQFVGQIRDQSG